MATITGYSRDVLLHLRSVANGRHVVAKQTAELIKAYGLRRPRRRRGCCAGRRAKPCSPAATSVIDQSANCLAAAASRQSTTATTIQYNIRNLCTPSLTVKNRHESAMDVP